MSVEANPQEPSSLAMTTPDMGSEGGPSISAGDLWGMFRRRLVLIILLFMLFGGSVFAGFSLWWTKYPGYTSVALIECVSNIPRANLSPEQERLRQDEHERFVLTLAQLLKSPIILEEVLKLTSVRNTQWWKTIDAKRFKGPSAHHIRLLSDLKAGPMRGTNYLRVSIECKHLKDPAVIVRGVVEQWLQIVRKRSADEFTDNPLAALKGELSDLNGDINDDRSRLNQLADRLPAGAIQNPGDSITMQKVKFLSEQVAKLRLELSQLEQFANAYNDPDSLLISAEDQAWVEQDIEVMALTQNLFSLRQLKAADEEVYGIQHRIIRQYNAQIRAGEEELDLLRTEKMQQRREEMRAAANSARDNTKSALFTAQNDLAKATATLQDQDHLVLEQKNLEQDIEYKMEYRQKLTDSINSFERIKAQRTAVNVNLAQEPADPLQKSSPSLLLLPLGLFVALGLSLVIGLGLELMDTSVRTSQDILRHLKMGMLGIVPDIDDEEVSIIKVETAFRDEPQSMVAEAFRQIRTNLQFGASTDQQRLILVTSPQAEDGKTTVACNLGLAFAQGGKRILLIDTNFRRPAIQTVFPSTAGPGLHDLLTSDVDLASMTQPTDTTGLFVLGCGAAMHNSPELLAGEEFAKILNEAKGSYDQVIIDSAPVLLASDALVMVPMVDGVVLVVRAKQNSRGAAKRALTLLTNVGAHVLGAVLNAAQVTRGGYYRQQLRDYYDYQDQGDRVVALPAPRHPSPQSDS